MDGSLLARLPLERLRGGRSLGASVLDGAKALRPRAGMVGRARRRARRLIAAHRRLRIALMCLPLAVVLLGGGWLWLRHSSYVAVEHVKISGVQGPQAAQIESALSEAARRMSTLDTNEHALREAVARFPVVQDVHASASFPHSLRISVTEQQPVAALTVSGVKTAVAANGVVLGPELLSSSLPTVTGSFEPARGQRLSNVALLESLRVLGAAPSALRKLTARVEQGPHGLTVAMQNGLLVYFGDARRPHAKWLSLARVLADQTSAGAVYVDVRLPGRPAAGFSAEEEASSASTSQAGTHKSSESTVAALAAELTGGKGEGSTTQTAEEGESTEAGQAEAGGESAAGEAPTRTPEEVKEPTE